MSVFTSRKHYSWFKLEIYVYCKLYVWHGRTFVPRIMWGHPWCRGSDGLLVNRSTDRSCTRGMIYNQIYLISPGCPRSSIVLQVQNRGLTHNSFHFISNIYVFYCFKLKWGFYKCSTRSYLKFFHITLCGMTHIP